MMKLSRRYLVIAVHFLTVSVAHHFDYRSVEDALERPAVSPGPGVCSYGRGTSCCVGWRNVNGVCKPVCIKACIHGECVGSDECLCTKGYTGPQCEEDVNECGLPWRPCSQRCMNTHGSYRCYCEPGFALNGNGHTCTRETECSCTRCQFGCQMEGGGEAVRCLCPPGLHLDTNNRTCKDIDECRGSSHVCPPRQTCKNTFGSFVCVCQDGFVMGTLRGSVQCRDQDECLTGSHRCSRRAQCVNTDGSYTCQCLEEYAGDGRTCWPRRALQSKASMYFQYKLSKRTRPVQAVQSNL